MKLKILLLALLLPAIADADTAWPGGIAFLELGPADGEPPVVEFNGKRVLVMAEDGLWRAAVGVPLAAGLIVGEALIGVGYSLAVVFGG